MEHCKLKNGKDAKVYYIGFKPDGGFKVTSNDKDFLTLVMWEAASFFDFSDENLSVTLEKNSVLQFKDKDDYHNFKHVHETNAPNDS